MRISRARYAQLYGPTVGDRVRLGDTNLWISPTEDRTFGPGGPGDEAVFGGGKVIRESMGQSLRPSQGAPDLVITGAVVLDHWGIVKADVGIKDGRIVALGKAGNPDTMDGVHPDLVIGPSTEVLAGNGKILTAGAIDCHVHLICPQILDTAAWPRASRRSSAAAPAPPRAPRPPRSPRRLLPVVDAHLDGRLADQRGACSARATPCRPSSMWEQLRAGASGFKLHEDWGSTPGRDRRLPPGVRRGRGPGRRCTPTR